MGEMLLEYMWEPFGEFFNNLVQPGRWVLTGDGAELQELFTFLTIDLEYRPERLRACIEMLEGCVGGALQPGLVDGGNDGALYYGGGYVLIASSYVDGERVLMTAEQVLVLFRNVMATMDSPDYNNPHAQQFLPFIVEVIETGEGAMDGYYRRGGVTPIMPEQYRT